MRLRRMPDTLDAGLTRDLVRRALDEDIGAGDVTTAATVPSAAMGRGTLLAKSACVVAGLPLVREVFRQLDAAVTMEALVADGGECQPGGVIAILTGPAAPLLAGERTALNFLQHLSGIATLTRRFVDAAAGGITILDTRKTIPTLRHLAKYAVRCGGGTNHRFGLFDGVLVKDNHIRLAGGMAAAVARARGAAPGMPIEVEAQSLAEVDDALAAQADVIMLDNLDDGAVREAVRRVRGRARIEVSGGVTLDRIPRLAATGADTVSIGALTHSAPAADICLEIVLA
jgi:nicotinate-nucleotide pyrophosphorylase (carboxylating)